MIIDTTQVTAGSAGYTGTTTKSIEYPPEILKLIETLGLPPKQKTPALVTKIIQLDHKELDRLTQFKKEHATSSSTKAHWGLTLSHSNIKHIVLLIQNKAISTLSSLPLIKGQEISVEITAKGLKIGTLEKGASPLVAGKSIQTAGLTSPASTNRIHDGSIYPSDRTGVVSPVKLGVNGYTSDQTINAPMSTKQASAVESELRQALSRTLPIAETPDKTLSKLSLLTSHLGQHTQNNAPAELKRLAFKLRNLIQNHTLTVNPNKPPSLSAMKHAIFTSGVFYEQKLLSAAHQKNHIAPHQPPESPNTQAMRSRLTPTNLGHSGQSADLYLKEISTLVSSDHKGALAQLASWLNSEQAQIRPRPLRSEPNDATAKLLANLLNLLSPRQIDSAGKAPAKTLVLELQKLILQSLARIQVQQYKSINTHTQEPTTSHSNPIHLDIPVKTPDGYTNIYVQLFEPRAKDEQKEKKKGGTNKRQAKWKVFLELELGSEGNLAVELSVCQKNMDATFWTEKEALRQKAQAGIHRLKQDLEEKGLNVIDLRCSSNTPPKQTMKMDYSLIDVQT